MRNAGQLRRRNGERLAVRPLDDLQAHHPLLTVSATTRGHRGQVVASKTETKENIPWGASIDMAPTRSLVINRRRRRHDAPLLGSLVVAC